MKTASWIHSLAGFFSFAAVAEAQGQTQSYGPWPGMMGGGAAWGGPGP